MSSETPVTLQYANNYVSTFVRNNFREPKLNAKFHLTPRQYRATYINTAMDAGFATAMSIRPKWAKDILSVAFGVYYLFFADEGDAKVGFASPFPFPPLHSHLNRTLSNFTTSSQLRKFRAVPTVEMLRTTWEKTANPYLLAMTYFDRPRVTLKKKIMIQRPAGSHYT